MLQISQERQGDANIWRDFWAQSELDALNLVRSPLWIVDLETQKICWGNDAALKLWDVPCLSVLKDYNFTSAVPASLCSKFRAKTKNKAQTWQHRIKSKIVDWTFESQGSSLSWRCYCSEIRTTFAKQAILVEGISPILETGQRNSDQDLTPSNRFSRPVESPQESKKRYQLLTSHNAPELISHAPNGKIFAVSRPMPDRTSIINLLSSQKQILEVISTDRDLEETLSLLLQAIEDQFGDRNLAIALLDKKGQPILEVKSYQRNKSKNKSKGKKWQSKSTPILSSQQTILGFFIIEDTPTRIATPEEGQLMHFASHIAGIAIERKQTGEDLELAETKYRSIFENSPVGIFQTSPDGHYLNANSALAQIYGYNSPKDLIVALTDVAHQLYVDPQRRTQFTHLLQENDIIADFESQVYRQDGTLIWISENTRAVRNKRGNLLYYEGTVQDITARRHAEEQLRYRALHDDLTQLPNRSCFLKHLEDAIAFSRDRAHEGLTYAVLFIDLDRFKAINDSLGHWMGDELLKSVAKRLQDSLAPHHIIARFGGDEFAVLLQTISGVDEAIKIAETLLEKLDTPFQIKTYELFTRGSIGIVEGGPYYTHPENLLRDADVTMYRAKLRGKGRYEVFDPQMQIQTLEKLQLENDLRRGLEREEFCLYYQPIICLSTGKLRGFEALVRWNHPQRGLVSPDEFIPLAEENGAIERLGWFVLKTACNQLQQWQEEIEGDRDKFQLNVNLSPLQLRQVDFIKKLEQICLETQIDKTQLKLEITESCLLEIDISRDRFQQLKALGMGLCIDDFGTGYSSLSRLHEFPIDTIKIDRSFMKGLQENTHPIAIIDTIITLARGLGMNLVAEGVETLSQIETLKSLGCDLAQGYFFSAPVAIADANQWVRERMNDRG
ncbi:putative bifunctional diguanylate cyclase/phosphodiesterase [Spirulina sp. 06S082]|uniref:putative bifunctional diguanylate cyclase/phosphodiesterase n=1 Tax=Spirulina sp. 06S082 TaxID=3110248 RepID=UPI002B21C921|nr:EAL domain-containing protein [Spirulina sp. 06S082]MEA5470796.1 EAL domain-containing protein [Spirulina sp. 06S082]